MYYTITIYGEHFSTLKEARANFKELCDKPTPDFLANGHREANGTRYIFVTNDAGDKRAHIYPNGSAKEFINGKVKTVARYSEKHIESDNHEEL